MLIKYNHVVMRSMISHLICELLNEQLFFLLLSLTIHSLLSFFLLQINHFNEILVIYLEIESFI